MRPVRSAIWISLILLTSALGARMVLFGNQAATLPRPVLPTATPAGATPGTDSVYVDVSVNYGAQLMLIDSAGRKTGYDPATSQNVAGVPGTSYADDSISDATDDSSEPAEVESRVLDVRPKSAATYSLKVSPTKRDFYSIQFFCGSGKETGANISAGSLGIAPGEEHSFILAILPRCSGRLVSGAFTGQNHADTALLTYAYPVLSDVHLSAANPFRLVIVYDRRLNPATFTATLNGKTIANLFHPKPETIESVSVPVKSGRNLVQLSVTGTSAGGSLLSTTDSFVVQVD